MGFWNLLRAWQVQTQESQHSSQEPLWSLYCQILGTGTASNYRHSCVLEVCTVPMSVDTVHAQILADYDVWTQIGLPQCKRCYELWTAGAQWLDMPFNHQQNHLDLRLRFFIHTWNLPLLPLLLPESQTWALAWVAVALSQQQLACTVQSFLHCPVLSSCSSSPAHSTSSVNPHGVRTFHPKSSNILAALPIRTLQKTIHKRANPNALIHQSPYPSSIRGIKRHMYRYIPLAESR